MKRRVVNGFERLCESGMTKHKVIGFKGCQRSCVALPCNKTIMWTVIWVAAALRAAAASSDTGSRSYHHSSPGAQSDRVVTSKPFTVGDDANAGAIKWRRDTATGASLIGASDPAKTKYSIECTDSDECAGVQLGGSDATFKPYTQDELNRILKRYGEADGAAESSDKVLSYGDGVSNQDKSKASWNLVDTQQQQQQQQQQLAPKNPYDDRRGWVTLEPMAWSSSHIQKWEPNHRPTWPPPPQDHGQPGYSPWASNRPVQRPVNNYQQPQHQQQYQQQQQQQQQQYQQQHQQSDWTTERPWIRPTYDYSAKPSSHGSHYDRPSAATHHGPQQSFYGWNSAEPDIITDGKPGQFPADAYHKPWAGGDYGQASYGPRPTEVEGDGQWVLLSSTKGYSIPHRPNRSSQSRSVSVDAVNRPVDAVGGSAAAAATGRSASSKRTVRLMVLPPDEDSRNVTTSHGGMIQVHVSGKSVDQEQREYAARAMDDADNDVRRASAGRSERPLPAAAVAMFLPVMVNRKRRHLPAAGPVAYRHVYPR